MVRLRGTLREIAAGIDAYGAITHGIETKARAFVDGLVDGRVDGRVRGLPSMKEWPVADPPRDPSSLS